MPNKQQSILSRSTTPEKGVFHAGQGASTPNPAHSRGITGANFARAVGFSLRKAAFPARTRRGARERGSGMLQKEFHFRALMVRDENGQYRLASAEEIIEAALEEMQRRFCRGTVIDSPEATKQFLQVRIGHLEHEVFAVLWLDLCAADAYVQ
jgi:hypothetical protein